MSIVVDNVSKIYSSQKALDNVSFTVGQNEICAFLGPNGAGKSTMMKIISCFLTPTSGNVQVCGYDVNVDSIEIRKKIGYLPESNPLYYEMYVKEYLNFVANIHKLGKNKQSSIDKIIEMTGLGPESHKKIGQLSKGYKQRVGISQALIHDPEVLILDEPTSGLDPNQLIDIRNLIKDIGKHKTVLLSTHIMQEVEAICDRIMIIDKGHLVANDKTLIIREKFGRLNCIDVEFDLDIEIDKLLSILGVVKVEVLEGLKKRLFIDSEKDLRSAVFEFAVANNLKVLSMNIPEISIERIFQQLTKK